MQNIPNYNKQRTYDRSIDELIGIAKGILADNSINTNEAIFLKEWIKANFSEYEIDNYPLNILLPRIQLYLQDNKLDKEEEKELIELLNDFTGGKPLNEQIHSMATALPLTTPAPEITFKDKYFCFTGKFTIGTRKAVEELIKQHEGNTTRKPQSNTDYLVIGILGSQDWIHSTYGRKIEQALEMQEAGHHIKIISEEHLIKFL